MGVRTGDPPTKDPAVERLERLVLEARETFDRLAHPNREVRTGREAREALSQSASAASYARDRLDHELGRCGEYCAFCLAATDALEPGDECEVRFPARSFWMPAKLRVNGRFGYWEAELTEEVRDTESDKVFPAGHVVKAIYAEHVRPKRGDA